MNQYDITFIGCDNIFKNVEELRDLIKLEKTKEKIIKSQIEYLNSDNSYGHPNKEVLSTLEYSKIYRTDIDGSIVVKIKNNKFKIETCSPQKGEKMNYYKIIKNKLIDNEIYSKIKDYSKERHKVITYFEIGKLLSEAGGKYGDNIIDKYSQKLVMEVGKKYNRRTLFRIKQFYKVFNNEKVSTSWTQLTWSHLRLLLNLEIDSINYYIQVVINKCLSVRELEFKIKSKEFERLPVKTRNKLISKDKVKLNDLVPNPILIKNKNNIEIVTEKVLHNLILEDIESFMKELGNSFCFIGSQYKIKIGARNNYIDILLFNIKHNCYVVIELKITEFKVEYISQVQKYMNYIDKNVKEISNNNTVGILICKRENKFVIEYCSDERIAVREYELV